MGKTSWWPIALVLACSAVAVDAAPNDKVGKGPLPAWVTLSEPLPVPADASGLSFVRRSDVLVHLDQRGQTQFQGYQVRILHPNALQVGNISIAWNPAAGSPILHRLRIHRGAEVIDLTPTAAFEVLRREDQLEAAHLNGVLTAVLRVPDLRVGDELELALTTPVSDPTLGGDSSGVLYLLPSPAPGRHRLGLSWADGQEPALRMTPAMAAVVQRGDRAVAFSFDNPPAQVQPKDTPPRFAWQRTVEYSDFADWKAVSKRFAPLFAAAAKPSARSQVMGEADRIAAAHTAPLERAAAALKLVQQDVRYVYVGLNTGNLTPASIDETWQRRYGDCKAKTVMLLAMLERLGIAAEAVLVNNSGIDDGLDQRLPSPFYFDHVVVRAKIGDRTYWLDGTLPAVARPSIAPFARYRWVLPVSAEGAALEPVPWRPAQIPDEITLHEIDARAGFDKPARITNVHITRGLKGLKEQIELSAVTPDQLRTGLSQQLVGDTWQTIDDVTWRYDHRAQASVLKIAGTGTITWDDDGGGARSLSLPGGGFSPPERRVRAAVQDQDLPYYNEPSFTCHVTTVRIPTATLPRQWSFNAGVDTALFGQNYYRAFAKRDGAIRMVRGFRVEQEEIGADLAKRDNARIAAFDNSMAWIYYSPSGQAPSAIGTANVPAVDEIDWTADQVPCLAEPDEDDPAADATGAETIAAD